MATAKEKENVRNVRECWGEDAPDWLLILAEHCDRSSQRKVSTAIGYSDSVVNQVLRKRYTGDMTAIEQAVRGAFLHATVTCPVLGELQLHRCLQHQRAKFSATNSMRVRLFKACHGNCPHSRVRRSA